MSSLNWYLHRLRAMDVAEAFGRVREKVRHKTERFALPVLKDVRLREASGDIPALPEKSGAPGALKQMLAADAAKLLAGKWTLFGWNEIQLSTPPNWHRDYALGVDVPTDGLKLNHRALPGGADVRAIWEINRWAEMVRLAMHGWLNDDAGAIQRAQGWLADWVGKNPLGKGINWSSALEAGLRLTNFCWFDALVAKMGDGRSEMGKRQRELVDTIVPAHVWWVNRYLSFGSSANNHRLGELTGLLIAVKRWPELEKIAGPADKPWAQIGDCVLAQFAEDGGNREQALHYHLFAFEMALHASRAMSVSDGPVIERLQRAAEFFVRMSHPQEPWDYGDSDDAQIVPLTMRRERAVAEWRAWMSGSGPGLQPACSTGILPVGTDGGDAAGIGYWLDGSSPNVGADVDPGQNARATHRLQACATGWWIAPESGMAVIERDGWKLRVDASPLGFGKMAAHGHCDALHVSIWDGEHALVIDPGTGGYFGSKELRAGLASWNAHNGPQPIEGFKTPRRAGTFLWAGNHARPGLDELGGEMHAHFEHEGYRFARTVRFLDGAKHLAVWDLEENNRSFGVRWFLAPECEIRMIDPNIASFEIVRGVKAWSMSVMPAADPAEVIVTSGVASRMFGGTQPCKVIQAVAQGWLRTEWRRLS